MREIVRDYQAAIDTLTVVIDKEAQQGSPGSSERIPPPKDNSEADALRERLSGLRAQVQTAATQVKLDEETLTRQQSALKTANQEFRRAQEEFDSAKADAERQRAGLQLQLAETLQEASQPRHSSRLGVSTLTSLIFEPVRQTSERLKKHCPPVDWTASSTRSAQQAAIRKIEDDKLAVRKQVETAQNSRGELDEAISRLEEDRKRAAGDEETKRYRFSARDCTRSARICQSNRCGRAGVDRRPRRSAARLEDHSGRSREPWSGRLYRSSQVGRTPPFSVGSVA